MTSNSESKVLDVGLQALIEENKVLKAALSERRIQQ